MKIGDLFLTNPNQLELLNNGVAFVKDVVTPEELKTLRFELKTFVCEGEYAKVWRRPCARSLAIWTGPSSRQPGSAASTAPANRT